jgi:N-acylneuraminate cytidylyltransferase
MNKVLAIIPARGGSKGIPRKNIVEVAGKPLIAYSINNALNCRLIHRVFVSTEDSEIAAVSKRYGAEIIDRPKELAEDKTLDLPVFEHALQYLKEKESLDPEIVVHLRPTAPYRKTHWLDESIKLLQQNLAADSVRSVSLVVQHPYRMFEISTTGFLDPIMKDRHPVPYLLRRQDLPPMYYYNCVIDVTRPETIFKKQSMTGNHILPYIINADEVLDIDTKHDLEWANFYLRNVL